MKNSRSILSPALKRMRRTLRYGFHRMNFDNRRFWNKRDSTNMEVGSGPGSRGSILGQKRQLIAEYMSLHDVTSVVDLGCGDIAVIDGLYINKYLGLDISDVIVERNKALKPEWSFNCTPISMFEANETFDMTLCLDVLIHQKKRAEYDAICAKIAQLNSAVILVSGYETQPSGWNVFFHEPLSQTLANTLPDRKFQHLASYRDTDLFCSRVQPIPLNGSSTK